MTVKSMVMEGEPKEMICQAVEQVHPDLLLVGSRGLGKLKRFPTSPHPSLSLPISL